MTRELKGLDEGPKAEIHIELLKRTLKKISNWKTPGHDGIHGFCFKTSTRNKQMPTRRTSTLVHDQRKDHIDPKGPK